MQTYWRKCSSCKKEIPFSNGYYTCSVSTCNAKSTNYVFCSVPCFERHLPGARHKDAAAINETSPPQGQSLSSPSTKPSPGSSVPQRRIIAQPQTSSTSSASLSLRSRSAPTEILIVASKLKNYIRNISDFNTSADVMSALSDIVRKECDRAIEKAQRDGRKTVMGRDFK